MKASETLSDKFGKEIEALVKVAELPTIEVWQIIVLCIMCTGCGCMLPSVIIIVKEFIK